MPTRFTIKSSPDITLYSYEFSPFATKVRCFLGFKGLQHKTFYVHPLRAKSEIPLGKQIPVLKIDDELHTDSTSIGLLLDEKFPQRPILPMCSAQERAKIMDVDSWVTAELAPLCFRLMFGYGGGFKKQRRNGSIGANGIHQTVNGGYPLLLRWLHPLLVPKVKFIRDIISASNHQYENNRQLVNRACQDLSAQLSEHLFLAQQSSVTLADLSAFSLLALPYLAGYDDIDIVEQYPRVMQWLVRVQEELPIDAGVREDLHRRSLNNPDIVRSPNDPEAHALLTAQMGREIGSVRNSESRD